MKTRPSAAPSTPLHILRKYWGYDSFRSCQAEIVDSVLSGHDTLGLMPTGGGKSITFQVPAMQLAGLTVVVTPLISLMKDQVDNLRARGIRAVYLCSGLTRREVTIAADRCRLGKAKLLYVAPERLRSPQFLEMLRTFNISLIVVDEAHCISQWGYDFRPSYLRIAELRKLVGADVPVLALTASATQRVRTDIMERLEFGKDARVFTQSFARPNISYVVRRTPAKIPKLIEILTKTAGTAIVYVRSRIKTRQTAEALTAAGIPATYYHAGLDPHDKAERQQLWKDGGVRVMVATNAFGMGIDKADVRTVVHLDAPPSLEEYYQEAGRAGRDGLHSFAVLLASDADKAILTRRLNDAFPTIDYVRRVYELAGNFTDTAVGEGYNTTCEFDVEKFCKIFNLQPAPVRGAMALLTQAGFIEYIDDSSARSRTMFLCRRDELYSFDLDRTVERVLLALMREYTGLFADYVYISETRLANITGFDADTIYQSMLTLQRLGVLHYVPRKAIPYIYYTTSRELPKYVDLPPAIYENLRRLMAERLDAVRRFVWDDSSCRALTILRYFGEDDAEACGHCDVCRAKHLAKNSQALPANLEAAALRIINSYSKGIEVDELARALRISRPKLIEILRPLAEDGKLCVSVTRIFPSNSTPTN